VGLRRRPKGGAGEKSLGEIRKGAKSLQSLKREKLGRRAASHSTQGQCRVLPRAGRLARQNSAGCGGRKPRGGSVLERAYTDGWRREVFASRGKAAAMFWSAHIQMDGGARFLRPGERTRPRRCFGARINRWMGARSFCRSENGRGRGAVLERAYNRWMEARSFCLAEKGRGRGGGPPCRLWLGLRSSCLIIFLNPAPGAERAKNLAPQGLPRFREAAPPSRPAGAAPN
jgi:hypothetical protein